MSITKAPSHTRIQIRRVGMSPKPTAGVMEQVEINDLPHTVTVIKDEHGIPIARPKLTFVIDRFTRLILSSYIDFDERHTETNT